MHSVGMTESVSEHLRFKLGSLPAKPGVYLMKSEQGRAIYVGKAKSLRSRVRSYFNKGAGDDARPQLQALVAKIRDIDYVVTESDKEALILESTYIKTHRPRDNIYLKDDKKYPFIRITEEAFPRIFWTRDIVHDGSRYLGPITPPRPCGQLSTSCTRSSRCVAVTTTCRPTT